MERRCLAPEVWDGDALTLWRERVLVNLILIAVILGPVALLPSLALAWEEARWGVIILDLAVYLLSAGILTITKTTSLNLRAGLACGAIYALGVGLILLLGPLGAGYIWLFGASVMAGGLIGVGGALGSLALNAVALAVAALLIPTGLLPWTQEISGPLHKWLVTGGNFLLLNALVSSALAMLLAGMRRALLAERKVSASLRRSESRFRSLAESAPDVIFSLDPMGRLDYANPALERRLGYSAEEIEGRLLWEMCAQGEGCPLARSCLRVLGMGETVRDVEDVLEHKDGRHLTFLLSGAPRLDHEGKAWGMLGLLSDVTEQRALSRQLLHSQKMEAVGTLAGGIAHDFNNILGAVVGFAELGLLTAREGGDASEELEEILAASQRATDLVKGILTFSRRQEPDFRLLDLNGTVARAAELLKRTVPKMINVELELGEELEPVNADPGQMEQVLLNLGANARDAMPGGGRFILTTSMTELDEEFCRLHPGALPGPYLRLTARDTGLGMDPETLSHVFEPFYTTKDQGRGTGLGLAMVFGIVKSHGGYISAYSEPGQGSEFKIFLPVGSGAPLGPGQEVVPPAEPPAGRGERVLLVDDDDAIREVARRILEDAGYRVSLAATGEEAVAEIESHPGEADMVILDLSMPGMGGAVCLERITAMEPGLKVVVASGYSGAAAHGQTALLASAFMDKPYTLAGLLSTTRRVLDDGDGPA